jgi:hypothetical protein
VGPDRAGVVREDSSVSRPSLFDPGCELRCNDGQNGVFPLHEGEGIGAFDCEDPDHATTGHQRDDNLAGGTGKAGEWDFTAHSLRPCRRFCPVSYRAGIPEAVIDRRESECASCSSDHADQACSKADLGSHPVL